MSDLKTVGEVIRRVEQVDLKSAVYRELQEFLAQFIPDDTYDPKVGISTTLTEKGTVPVDVIEEVRDEIEAKVCEIELEAHKLKLQKLGAPTAKPKPKRKAPVRRTNVKKKKAAPKKKVTRKTA